LITTTAQSDRKLWTRLDGLAGLDKDYWSFKENSRRGHGHGLFQYPAMMVPQMVKAILHEVTDVHPEIEWVTDPFAGSGTILTESMRKGLSFAGRDINPLAILLCRTKAGPFFLRALQAAMNELTAKIAVDRKRRFEADFVGIDKWFQPEVKLALSRIRRNIMRESSLSSRRFFWVALAETVRLVSNSRTSTFKLHVRPAKEIRCREVDAVAIFNRVLSRNFQNLESLVDELRENGLLDRGRYKGEIELGLEDSRIPFTKVEGKCDVLVTSPPYGDNGTTVPYGQFSFLPLAWINLADIDPAARAESLRTTHEIDFRSLGGSRRMKAGVAEALTDKSIALKRLLGRLSDEPADRALRVTIFFRDLSESLPLILKTLRPGGLMIWVLGNRRVAGKQVPLDRILVELLESLGAVPVATLKRRIHSKRMALKNNIAKTMSAETILVMRNKT
jgi:hypothetical protein